MTRVVNPSLERFADRSVFVTGHTGFKGSWLSLWLHRLGARVTGYSRGMPTQPNHFDLAGVHAVLDAHHEGDLRDAHRLRSALEAAQPQVVLHLAAQSVVRDGYRDPHETFDVNVMGTAALLDAVRALKRPCVVLVITTDKVYDNREHVWGYREIDPLGGHDPYSASKAACDLLTASYRQSFFSPQTLHEHGVKLAIARAGNVIGGGDFTVHALIPDLVRARASGKPVEIRAPDAVRPWQHVLDCLHGYLTLAATMLASDEPQWCDAWNFGPLAGNELPVRDLVERFLSQWGDDPRAWLDTSDPAQPHEAKVLRLSIDKALWQLNWRPRWDVDDALAYTAAWYRSWNEDHASVPALSRGQIEAYEMHHQALALS